MGLLPGDVVVSFYLLRSVCLVSLLTPPPRAGSGFKISVQDLSSLALRLGPHTTSPQVSLGVSVNYEPFYTVNVTEGVNEIPLTGTPTSENVATPGTASSVRINVEGWQNNRMNLEEIVLNQVCNAIDTFVGLRSKLGANVWFLRGPSYCRTPHLSWRFSLSVIHFRR